MSDQPIKFRCYRCGKLLGASARRAGAVATCPQCRAEIQVPEPGAGSEAEPVDPAPLPEIDLLSPEEIRVEPEFAAIVSPSPAPGDPVIPAIRYDPSPIRPAAPSVPRPADVVLAPAVVLAWSLLVLAAVPLAFLAGLLLGHFVWK
ncbi:hypothetical protein [Planctomyces sp. SH-PL62]|uniref:hypothetical protein n=1 Tax=Planctomyces sp. SH-PL62 TaxID=1636152 RepID=UPI00078DE6BB|nr:hypothetical protein [Planctomyces sp. SH-PL62]AMV40034.1 hypothetical protein VT85_21550 [Planctomyces sp. SH-PL62]